MECVESMPNLGSNTGKPALRKYCASEGESSPMSLALVTRCEGGSESLGEVRKG